MAKILNLDKLDTKVGKARELCIGGKFYPIEEMTVANFIATTKEASRLEAEGATLADMVEASIDLILRSVPALPRSELEGRSLEILNTIAAFVRGDEVAEAEDAPEGEGEAGK